ncbi:MAG: hydantoinase/oxoprolinase family protein [Deltaproteobacteria bacterium]|nr:hydantoinase/oxoprolinase family protein [Deltaproteobacteria bacterium]
MNSINIDMGGTFTDCYVLMEGEEIRQKVPTTPDDLTRGFKEVVGNIAREFGMSSGDLLSKLDIIRYATTLATNALITRRGPKLGLITTAGFEDTMQIGRGSIWHEALPTELKRNVAGSKRPETLVPVDRIFGVKERIDHKGQVLIALEEEEVRKAVEYLFDRGVEGFVICYLNSFQNPDHENMTKRIIEEIYPSTLMGHCPIFLSSEVLSKKNEYERLMTTVLSAYLHPSLLKEIAGLKLGLEFRGDPTPLFLVHNSGGMGPINKTTAVQTHNAGPVAALSAAAFLGNLYNMDVVVTDMGGTSFDIGVATGGEVRSYASDPLIEWWRVGFSMVETKSIGAGGGSIAWLNELLGNIIEVGPQSAGALPGPVCYGRGGTLPTVTDADVVLGYIDPDYFLGGKMTLNKEAAIEAVKQIAEPLGLSVEEAALSIKRIVDANMGNEIYKEINLKGYDPREFMLIAAGGAGPVHCAGYSDFIEVSKSLVCPYSSVFSAFGISVMDIVMIYEATNITKLYNPVSDSYLIDYGLYNDTVMRLQEQAFSDLEAEGFDPRKASLSLELEMRYGQQTNLTRVLTHALTVNKEEDIKNIINDFNVTYGQMYSEAAAYPQGGVEIVNFNLRCIVPTEKKEIPVIESKGPDPARAFKGQRQAYWEKYGYAETSIYDWDRLASGNEISGPSIIEARDTTVVLPHGKKFIMDEYLNGIIINV